MRHKPVLPRNSQKRSGGNVCNRPGAAQPPERGRAAAACPLFHALGMPRQCAPCAPLGVRRFDSNACDPASLPSQRSSQHFGCGRWRDAKQDRQLRAAAPVRFISLGAAAELQQADHQAAVDFFGDRFLFDHPLVDTRGTLDLARRFQRGAVRADAADDAGTGCAGVPQARRDARYRRPGSCRRKGRARARQSSPALARRARSASS